MKWLGIVIGVLLGILLVMGWNESLRRAATPPAEVGRYQVVAVKHTGRAGNQMLETSDAVMVDTSTGRIWVWKHVASDKSASNGWRQMHVEGISEEYPFSQ